MPGATELAGLLESLGLDDLEDDLANDHNTDAIHNDISSTSSRDKPSTSPAAKPMLDTRRTPPLPARTDDDAFFNEDAPTEALPKSHTAPPNTNQLTLDPSFSVDLWQPGLLSMPTAPAVQPFLASQVSHDTMQLQLQNQMQLQSQQLEMMTGMLGLGAMMPPVPPVGGLPVSATDLEQDLMLGFPPMTQQQQQFQQLAQFHQNMLDMGVHMPCGDDEDGATPSKRRRARKRRKQKRDKRDEKTYWESRPPPEQCMIVPIEDGAVAAA